MGGWKNREFSELIFFHCRLMPHALFPSPRKWLRGNLSPPVSSLFRNPLLPPYEMSQRGWKLYVEKTLPISLNWDAVGCRNILDSLDGMLGKFGVWILLSYTHTDDSHVRISRQDSVFWVTFHREHHASSQ